MVWTRLIVVSFLFEGGYLREWILTSETGCPVPNSSSSGNSGSSGSSGSPGSPGSSGSSGSSGSPGSPVSSGSSGSSGNSNGNSADTTGQQTSGHYGNGRKKRSTNEYKDLSPTECLKTCAENAKCHAFKFSGECYIWGLSKAGECNVDSQGSDETLPTTLGSEKIFIKSFKCK